MISAAPPVLAIEGDSAWIVILAVSAVTLPAVLLLRRVIGCSGGLASGLLLSLPLVLPLIAALSFDHAAFPVVALLHPAEPTMFQEPNGLLHLLFLADERGRVLTAYTLSVTAGAWMLWIGLSVSSFMLVRRFIGTMLLHRLIGKSRPLRPAVEGHVARMVTKLSSATSLKRVPEVLVMPEGTAGAFAVAGRGGRILISPDLLRELDHAELEGILAHEIAHLEARDVHVTFTAGFLRDLVAWNPIAQLSYRRLMADREVEADRRAAALTGDPLAVASGLVRLCEMNRGRRGRKHSFAVAFGGGRVTRRVTNLLALADGRGHAHAPGTTPYIVAALVVAVLGFQAGAKIAAQGPGVYAIALGTVENPTARMWTSPPRTAAAKAAHRRWKVESRLHNAMLQPANTGPGVSLKAKFRGEFTQRIQRIARRAGFAHEIQVWDLYRLQAFSGISIYRLTGPI